MPSFEEQLVAWAQSRRRVLGRLVAITGSVEGWLRAEAALEAFDGGFGTIRRVEAERNRWDLLLHRANNRTTAVEFKLIYNNKNIFGDENGAAGVRADVEKLVASTWDRAYAVAFFGFFDRRVRALNESYGRTVNRVRVQPELTERLPVFAPSLATTVVSRIVDAPSDVRVLISRPQDGFWLGMWIHRAR